MTAAGAVEGGQIIPVSVEDSQVNAKLIGPDNTFRKGSPPATEPFTVSIDPLEAVAKFTVQDQKFVLREGEWSDWVHIRVPTDSLHRERERNLPFLFEAGASAIRACTYRRSISILQIPRCPFPLPRVIRASFPRSWRVLHARNFRGHKSPVGRRARRQGISGTGEDRAGGTSCKSSIASFPSFTLACSFFISPALI